MKVELVSALVRAHYDRNDAWFRSLAIQAASHIKDEKRKAEMLGHANRVVELPTTAREFAFDLPPRNLDELILPVEARDDIIEIARELRGRAAFLGSRLRPRARILFHGPPGNGKTSAAGALAGLVGVNAYGVALDTLIGQFMGVTGSNLGKLFASLSAGCMLVVDEIDAVGSARISADSAGAQESNRTVNTFLTLLDRVQDGILVAITNRRELLDAALLRRFDAEIYFPAPTDELAEELAMRLCSEFGVQRDAVGAVGSTNFDAVTRAVVKVARREMLLRFEATSQGAA